MYLIINIRCNVLSDQLITEWESNYDRHKERKKTEDAGTKKKT